MQMFGATAESQLLDRRLSELFTSHQIRAIEDIKRSVNKGDKKTAEFEIKNEVGNIGYIELSYTDIRNYSGVLVGKMVSIHNITDRILLEIHLRDISAKLVDALEAERKRVARELHDGVGASLVSLKFAFEEWIAEFKHPTKISPSIIHRIQRIIDEVHNISKNLHPSILHDLGFSTAVRAFCRETMESFPAINIDIRIDVSDSDLPEKLAIVLYRVIQEGITNAVKHADPRLITLKLAKQIDRIELVIEDDGKGFDTETLKDDNYNGKGMGLKNIQDRAEIYGGTFALKSTIDLGTDLTFNWPI